tara:strand:+ start:794 stop:1294 length:501 start_codon:yes stop_codon:yes gene_type:complete
MFKKNYHLSDLYNTLLSLSRNIFFYKNLKLPDTFETRLYLMFFHFSILMIVFKKKEKKFDQKSYDNFFHNIENNLRELGFGDIAVNKKMKTFNKILYDILLKLEINAKDPNTIRINSKIVSKYFNELNNPKSNTFIEFERYFVNFFNFCFELSIDNMIKGSIKFKL